MRRKKNRKASKLLEWSIEVYPFSLKYGITPKVGRRERQRGEGTEG